MLCEHAKELLLSLEAPDTELSTHLAGCDNCREFQSLQQQLDQQLAAAFRAPALSADFRRQVQSRIRAGSRPRWEGLPMVVAPVGGIVSSGLCALAAPDMAAFLVGTGLALSCVSYVAHLLFVWLTEELGEG